MTDILMLVLIPFTITALFGLLIRLTADPKETSDEDREWWHAIK